MSVHLGTNEGIPSNPVLFIDGELAPNDLSKPSADPQNVWTSVEAAKIWIGVRVLGLNSTSPYKEDGAGASTETLIEEADSKRANSEKYTDKRSLESLGAIVGVEDQGVLASEFRGRSVADIGSGEGRVADDLRRQAGAHVTEIDFSPQAFEGGLPIFEGRGKRLVADGTDLTEIEDGAVERSISMFSTSVHTDTVRKRLRGLTEQLRITEVGGRALVVPLLGGLVLRQQRWHFIDQQCSDPSLFDLEMQKYRAQLKQEAAMDYALISLTSALMSVEAVSLTPVLKLQETASGLFDSVSGIFDVHMPLPRAATEPIIDQITDTFSK